MNRFYGALNTIYSKTRADWSAEGSKDIMRGFSSSSGGAYYGIRLI